MSVRIIESPTAALTEAPSMKGEVLGGRYTILDRLAQGGVGVVYLASDAQGSEPVVLKLLGPHAQDDPDAVARFEREVRRLSAVAHPNAVRMLGHGYYEGRAFLVMEYLQGEVLEARLRARGALSLPEAVSITAQLLEAVGHAHEQGMMIRDIKPSNIMLCPRDGQADHVVLLDFGLAKLLDEGTADITRSQIVGTMGYIAPEVLRGATVDLRVDVYAIGVMLYRMLSGRFPFTGDNDAAVFFQTVHVEAPKLVELLPLYHGVPDELIALVHECLRKEPSARPEDAIELKQRLAGCVPATMLQGVPNGDLAALPSVPLLGVSSPGAPPARRRVTVAAALVAVLLGGGGLAWGLATGGSTEPEPVLPANIRVESDVSPTTRDQTSVAAGAPVEPEVERVEHDAERVEPEPTASPVPEPTASPSELVVADDERHRPVRRRNTRARRSPPPAPVSPSLAEPEAGADPQRDREPSVPASAEEPSVFLSVPKERAGPGSLLSAQDR